MLDFFSFIGDFFLKYFKIVENFLSGYAEEANNFFSEYFVFFSAKIDGIISFSYLDAVFSLPPLTLAFIFLIGVVWFYFFFIKFNDNNVTSSQTILTSLGIFGTFLGIAVGLSSFNPADISGSVPMLIDGLKTSFWSSVIGLLTALTIKFKYMIKLHFIQQKAVDNESPLPSEEDDKTVEDVVFEIKNLNESIGSTENDKPSLINSVNKLNSNFLQQMGEQNNLLNEIKFKLLSTSSVSSIKDSQVVKTDKNHPIASNITVLTQSVNQLVKSQTTTNEQIKNLMNSFSENAKTYEKLVSNFDKNTNTLVNDIEVLNSQLKTLTSVQPVIGESQLG